MRRYRFIDTTAYSQYLFKLAMDKVVTSGTASALTSTARRGHFIIPQTSSSSRVIYSKNADKIIANANGLHLYVAAENKSYPLRARKSYQAEGSDYIYIEFINPWYYRDYSDAALEARRKLNSINLDELTPWIWKYNALDVEAAAALFQRPESKKFTSNDFTENEKKLIGFAYCVFIMITLLMLYNNRVREYGLNSEFKKQYLDLKHAGAARDSSAILTYYEKQDISELEESLNLMLGSNHHNMQALYNDIEKFNYISDRSDSHVPFGLLREKSDLYRRITHCMILAFCTKYEEKYVVKKESSSSYGYLGRGFAFGRYGEVGGTLTCVDSYPESKKLGVK